MQTFNECYPCLLRQALDIARRATTNVAQHTEIIRRTLLVLQDHDMRRSPPEISERVHEIVRDITGCDDPFADLKRQYNALTLSMLPTLRTLVESSPDPFDTAVRLALAGNIIDFGTPGEVTTETVMDSVASSAEVRIHGATTGQMKRVVDAAGSILYVADNAGELSFDRLLIEIIGPDRVTLVVRGGPVLNDVTIEDATQVGLVDMVPVVDSGLRLPGVALARASAAFHAGLEEADLVISKGQGNYETLSDLTRPVFFLFKVKCEVVARHVGVPLYTMIVEGRNL